ncbi:metallophosphoesterase family protein [Lederbergia galactosidilytica]|uniref:metallophosphoesterase family protein n=1 Tax=Lederbergia galactosidilytica TaxID=217031 RepID=UPI000717496B|nr:metallophosphoesterase [Lederbergia galactosidilytica]MBP1916921.1 3',5'-cyclic AMP phosphodiesterase CpdA [Lederbergia galactosidilytica]
MSTPILEFFVISDFQLTVENKESHDKLRNALRKLKAIDSFPDALVVNGDMINDGKEESYQIVREIMEREFYPPNTFFTIGNHEYFKNDGNRPSIERFLQFTGLEKLYYERTVEGFPFLFLGSESWGPIGAPTKDSAVLSKEQLNWLAQTLKKYKTMKLPIFVFLHQPLPFTLAGTDLPYYQNGVIQARELHEILSSYPQAILFSGHTHWDLHSPKMFMKSRFAMANSGAIYNTYGPDGEGHEMVTDPNGCQGLYIQVYDSEVVIRPLDLAKGEWIDPPFSVK